MLIQSFNRRRVISPTGFTLLHSADTYRRVDEVGLTLDDRLAAMLVGTSLRFLSFHAIRQVLDLSAYFAEATVPELRAFARTDGIHVVDEEVFVAMADTWVRKKVTLIGRSGILAAVSSAEIQRAALEFGIEVQTVHANGREAVTLPGVKAELKVLLKFLDEIRARGLLALRGLVDGGGRADRTRAVAGRGDGCGERVQVGRAAHACLLGRGLRRGRGGAWHRLERALDASDARCAGHALDLASGPFDTADAGRASHALDGPVDCRSRGLPGPGLSARSVRVAGALPSPA